MRTDLVNKAYEAVNDGSGFDRFPRSGHNASIGLRLCKLRLDRIDVRDNAHLLILGRIRLCDRLTKLDQRLAQFAELCIDLVSVTERDDVLASGFDFDSVKFRHREFTRTLNFVYARCGNLVVRCDGGNHCAASGPNLLFDLFLFNPALAYQVCEIALDFLLGESVMGF